MMTSMKSLPLPRLIPPMRCWEMATQLLMGMGRLLKHLNNSIVSDVGGEFSGTFTNQLIKKLGIQWDLTVTARPQAHCTERTVGKVLDAVRLMLVEEGSQALNWSEPAVLSTTAYLLNSEHNEEAVYSAFDLTFGKEEMTEFPDIFGTPGKSTLALYMDALQQHLTRVQASADECRTKRQKQRQEANTPSGDHRYSANDLVLCARVPCLENPSSSPRTKDHSPSSTRITMAVVDYVT